jgi:PAS domain-containing protein
MEEWVKEFSGAVTVCDLEGKILYMNEKSCRTFAGQGGKDLIGRSLLDCHPEPARSKLQQLLQAPWVNCYTVEKEGVRKLIYQAPWSAGGKACGLVELSLELPGEIPNYVRK